MFNIIDEFIEKELTEDLYNKIKLEINSILTFNVNTKYEDFIHKLYLATNNKYFENKNKKIKIFITKKGAS